MTKYLLFLTVLLSRNFRNFAKVNTTKINQNAVTLKISTREKMSKFPKYLLKETNY